MYVVNYCKLPITCSLRANILPPLYPQCSCISNSHSFKCPVVSFSGLVSFWFSSIVECLRKCVHTRSLFTGHHLGFCCSQYELTRGCPLSLLMMQVAFMPLSLVSIQALLISHVQQSCQNSTKLQQSPCMIMIINLRRGTMGCMLKIKLNI